MTAEARKRCTACGAIKAVTCFYAERGQCKECHLRTLARRHLEQQVRAYLNVPDPLHSLIRRELLREAQARGGIEEVRTVMERG